MKNKKILSLMLVGCLSVSTVSPLYSWGKKPKAWHNPITKFFNNPKEEAAKYNKTLGGLIIVGMLFLLIDDFKRTGADYFKGFLFNIGKKTKIIPLLKRLGNTIGIKKADEETEHDAEKPLRSLAEFDPKSIDPIVRDLRDDIREARLNGKEIPIPNLMLFGGPSQIGKTTYLKCLAREIGAKYYFCINITEILDKYVGNSPKAVRNLINKAEELSSKESPCVIILDEIDAVINKNTQESKTGVNREVAAILQSKIDNMREKIEQGKTNTFLWATTNYPERMPNETLNRFIREGGFYELKLPNCFARKAILERLLKKECIQFITKKEEKEEEEEEGNQTSTNERWAFKMASKTAGKDIGYLEGIVQNILKEKRKKDRLTSNFDPQPDKDIEELIPKKSALKQAVNKFTRLLQCNKTKDLEIHVILVNEEDLATDEQIEQFLEKDADQALQNVGPEDITQQTLNFGDDSTDQNINSKSSDYYSAIIQTMMRYKKGRKRLAKAALTSQPEVVIPFMSEDISDMPHLEKVGKTSSSVKIEEVSDIPFKRSLHHLANKASRQNKTRQQRGDAALDDTDIIKMKRQQQPLLPLGTE